MLQVPVYNMNGEKVRDLQIDEATFGSQVNVDLVKQAVVTYHANKRQGSAKTKSRGEVAGHRTKMYRQKGTGNARHGTRQAPILRGGGHTFAKQPRDFTKTFPKKMRRAALRSAILAKLLGNDLCVVEGLKVEGPKTKTMVGLLKNLGINRKCILALEERNKDIYLSSRNIQDLMVRITAELNAYDVATRTKMIVTAEAMEQLCQQEA